MSFTTLTVATNSFTATTTTSATSSAPVSLYTAASSSAQDFRMEDIVRRLSYKPGWEFAIVYVSGLGNTTLYRPTHDGTPVLRVTFPVIDIHTRKPVKLVSSISLPDVFTDEGAFLALIHRTLIAIETHELDEWLMVDGRPLREAHPQSTYTVQGYTV